MYAYPQNDVLPTQQQPQGYAVVAPHQPLPSSQQYQYTSSSQQYQQANIQQPQQYIVSPPEQQPQQQIAYPPEQQPQNQYYYYYGGNEAHLDDINPSQEQLQNEGEGIAETKQFSQYDEYLASPQLLEQSILNESPTSPALLYNANNKTYSMPIRNIDISTELHIATAFVSMKITFKNTGKRKVNALFILPCHGTVTSTKVNINNGARYLDTAFIDNKSAQQFEAKQSRKQNGNEPEQAINAYIPNLFRLPIADIAKNEIVTIKIDYMQSLEFVESRYHFYIPLRFGDGVLLNENNNMNNVNIKCSINCLTPGIQYGSTTHKLLLIDNANLRCKLISEPKQYTNNRDFHLFYSVQTNAISAALLCNSDSEYQYDPSLSFTCFVNPPTKTEGIFRRDIVFLLDRSGSMTGKPFADAVNGLIFALNTLTSNDRFSIIAFDHEQIMFDPRAEATGFTSTENINFNFELYDAQPNMIERAILFLNRLCARGMTDIQTPLMLCINYLNTNYNNNNIPFIVLLTDGAVDNEKEIVREITEIENNKIRILTFGIGQFCNEYFLKMLSFNTRGWNDGSIDTKDLYPKIRLMMDKAKTPILTDIELEIPNHIKADIYPKTIPDLFMNGPIVISGRYSGQMPQQIILKGKLQNGAILAIPIRCDLSDIIPIDKVFLKQRMDQLTAQYWLYDDEQIKQQIVDISINETFPSPFTSMVAYELTPDEKRKQDNDEHQEKESKKNKKKVGGLSGTQIAALAGGAVVVGAGVLLLGSVAATMGNINIIDGIGGGIGDIADAIGGIDCPCDSCIDAISCGNADCGLIANIGSCGICESCDGCLDAMPCADCGGITVLCESCGSVVGGCFGSVGDCFGSVGDCCGSVGDLCGNICEFIPNCVGSVGDLCGNLCEFIPDCIGGLGDVFGGLAEGVGDMCGKLCDMV